MSVQATNSGIEDLSSSSDAFGDRLKYNRKLRNLSLEDLADLMKTNVSQIWRLESEKANPTLDTIQKLCTVLEMQINQLVPSNQNIGDDDEKYFEFYRSRTDEEKAKIRSITYLL